MVKTPIKRIRKCMKNRWREHEKYQLWVAFETAVPLEAIARYLNRTYTAINKQASRFGVRNKSHALFPAVRTQEQLSALITQCGLDAATIGHECQFTRCWQPSPYTIDTLTKWGFKLPSPWAKNQRNISLPKASMIRRTLRPIDHLPADMRYIISYLRRNGHSIKAITPKPPLNHRLTLNDKPVSEQKLLTEANKLRIEQKEVIFLVEGVTYEE